MEIISWIVVGCFLGVVARTIMPGPAAGGLKVAIPIGMLGAIAGGLLGTSFKLPQEGFHYLSCLVALDGALLFLFMFRCCAMRARVELH